LIDVENGAGAVSLGRESAPGGIRATTSLARLLKETGRRGEARATLGEIYNWFSEDLKGAKALLEELAG
jgi:hypothetical protein